EYHRLAFLPELVRAAYKLLNVDPEFFETARIPDGHTPPIDSSGHAFSRERLKVAGVSQRYPAFLRGCNDCLCQWMLTGALQTGSETQQFSLILILPSNNGDKLG